MRNDAFHLSTLQFHLNGLKLSLIENPNSSCLLHRFPHFLDFIFFHHLLCILFHFSTPLFDLNSLLHPGKIEFLLIPLIIFVPHLLKQNMDLLLLIDPQLQSVNDYLLSQSGANVFEYVLL